MFCVIVIVKLLSWAVLPFLHSRWVPSKNGPVFCFLRPSMLHWLHHVFLLFANLGPIQLSPWIFLLLMPRLLLSRWSIPGFFVHMNVIVCYSTINIFQLKELCICVSGKTTLPEFSYSKSLYKAWLVPPIHKRIVTQESPYVYEW